MSKRIHLHLVKLVDTKNSFYILSVTACLSSKAGRKSYISFGQFFFLKGFIHSQRSQGMFRASYKIDIIFFYVILVFFLTFREPSHFFVNFRFYHDWRNNRLKTLLV